MPRVCSICSHTKRNDIDQAIATAQTSNVDISTLYGVSEAAIRRHATNHLPATLGQAAAVEEVARADDLLRELRALRSKAYRVLLKAEEAGDLRTALLAIGQARSCLELLAKIEGKVSDAPVVNVILSQEWTQVRAVIVQSLGPYPDARAAVAEALLRLDHARE